SSRYCCRPPPRSTACARTWRWTRGASCMRRAVPGSAPPSTSSSSSGRRLPCSREEKEMLMRWIAVVLGLLVAFAAASVAAQEPKSDQDKVMYALGVQLAGQLAPFALTPAEVEMVKSGMMDAALNRPHKAEPRDYMAKILELRNQRMAVAAATE